MRFGKITLTELPNINNVPIQNQLSRFDAVEIGEQVLGVTAVSPKMYIGDDGNFNFSFYFQKN